MVHFYYGRQNLIKSKAFTLAEVLITLGIIGVVAAVTLPTLIAKYQEIVWLNQFKQTYSILSQAYVRASDDMGGYSKDWGLPTTSSKEASKQIYNIFSKYLKFTGVVNQYKTIKNLNGEDDHSAVLHPSKGDVYSLSNGALIQFGIVEPDAAGSLYNIGINVDINGQKGPNMLGKDVFMLFPRADRPMITGYDLWWVSEGNCSIENPASNWTSGGACAIWVIKHGNMDYLHREISHEEWIK